jgi:hypothetical protein
MYVVGAYAKSKKEKSSQTVKIEERYGFSLAGSQRFYSPVFH